ncbi:MAG: hypothetical protein R2681_16245 [Pyrinomonadaceae bacterium]
MIRTLTFLFFVSFTFISLSISLYSQTTPQDESLATIPMPSVDYEPGPDHPYGRLNPEAPPETAELGFLIGEFDCEDRIFNPKDNKWYKMKVLRKAEYILNGFAIQDRNWTPILNSTNIRAFDPISKKWQITYFKTPYSTGVWSGGKEGENMVFLQEGKNTISRLTFFDIGTDGYSWKAETVTDETARINWEFTCKRRK